MAESSGSGCSFREVPLADGDVPLSLTFSNEKRYIRYYVCKDIFYCNGLAGCMYVCAVHIVSLEV